MGASELVVAEWMKSVGEGDVMLVLSRQGRQRGELAM